MAAVTLHLLPALWHCSWALNLCSRHYKTHVGENCPSVSAARGMAARVCRGTLLPPRQEALEQRCPGARLGWARLAPEAVPLSREHLWSPRLSRARGLHSPGGDGCPGRALAPAAVPEEGNLGHTASPRTRTADAAKGNKVAGERGTNWLESNRGMERSDRN